MARSICTFNVNNLYARYRFGQTFPGDRTGQSLRGEGWGYLPRNAEPFLSLNNEAQRALAAEALSEGGGRLPDVLCLQEVESLLALRRFNDEYLGRAYPYALLIDSRDYRHIDVAVLSKLDIRAVRTHVDEPDPEPDDPSRPWLFSRDCLELTVALNRSGSRALTLFINHLKSRYAETPAESRRAEARRARQAKGILRLLRRRFPGSAFHAARFAVVGDLNDTPTSPALAPLFRCDLEDALARLPLPEDRWTHWFRSEGSVAQLDHVLLSPRLAAETRSAIPRVERRGIGFARVLQDGGPGPRLARLEGEDDGGGEDGRRAPFRFPRFEGVGPDVAASDHAPVFFDVA